MSICYPSKLTKRYYWSSWLKSHSFQSCKAILVISCCHNWKISPDSHAVVLGNLKSAVAIKGNWISYLQSGSEAFCLYYPVSDPFLPLKIIVEFQFGNVLPIRSIISFWPVSDNVENYLVVINAQTSRHLRFLLLSLYTVSRIHYNDELLTYVVNQFWFADSSI